MKPIFTPWYSSARYHYVATMFPLNNSVVPPFRTQPTPLIRARETAAFEQIWTNYFIKSVGKKVKTISLFFTFPFIHNTHTPFFAKTFISPVLQGRNMVYPGPIDPYFLAVILIPEPHFPQNFDP